MCGDGHDFYPTLTYINNMIGFPLVLLYRPLILCHLKSHAKWTKGLHLPPNEQKILVSSLTLGKAPSPNGVIVEFFLTYWPLIKAYYKQMVHTSIPHGKFNFLKPSTKFHGLPLFWMKKFGIGTSFTNMTLLLFCDAFGSINLNM